MSFFESLPARAPTLPPRRARRPAWAHPLPPDGPVTLVVSWPAQGIEEARAELDGAAIRAAAQRAVTLWPEGPAPESATGWTTSTITATQGAEDD